MIVYNETSWKNVCETLSIEANKGSGLSHGYYVQRFSMAIDAEIVRLPSKDRQKAISVARNWDYSTVDELENDQEYFSNNGCCTHGIDLGCCPAGCE